MIRIVDKQNNQLAILNNLINPVIKEQINGEYIFTFTTIIEELKSEYIHHDNYIEADDNLFQISKYTKERTKDNKLLVIVLAEQVSYKLIDYTVPEFNYPWETAIDMLQTLLLSTDFELGTVNVPGKTGVQLTEEYTKREVLNHIANNFRGEFEFKRYKIHFLTQRGVDRGVEFRVGKNVKGIKKIVDNTKKDEEGNPYTSYEVEIVELNEEEDFKGLEGFEIGDRVKILDAELGINVSARIIEIEKDPSKLKQERNTRVILGNFIDNIAGELAEQRRRSNLVAKRSEIWDRSQYITPEGTFLTERLEGIISTLQNEIRAGLGTVQLTENNGAIITDQPTEESSTMALRLLGGRFAIANSKKPNGEWNFRTFGDGNGFTADEINGGTINGNIVNVTNLRAENITVGKLTDDQIEGAERWNALTREVNTWFGNHVPTLNNYPTSNWNTADYDNYLGDLFYDNSTGEAYRFSYDNDIDIYSWVQVQDTLVTQALQIANDALDLAGKKNRVFYSTPIPPYEVGDLWSQGASGDLMVCVQTKTKNQSYHATDWAKAVKYTDDTKILEFSSDGFITKDEAKSLLIAYEQLEQESVNLLAIAKDSMQKTAYISALSTCKTAVESWLNIEYPAVITIGQRNELISVFRAVQDTKTALQNKVITEIAIVENELYNGVFMNRDIGFRAVRSDNKARVTFNATDGLRFENRSNTGLPWSTTLYADPTTEQMILTGLYTGTLNASQITAGIINADRIGAKSISLAKVNDDFAKDFPLNNNPVFSSFAQTTNQNITETNQALVEQGEVINQRIDDEVQDLENQIATEVSNRQTAVETLTSSITQTASQIRQEVSQEITKVNEDITTVDGKIDTESSTRATEVQNLQSSIEQTASQIRQEVTNTEVRFQENINYLEKDLEFLYNDQVIALSEVNSLIFTVEQLNQEAGPLLEIEGLETEKQAYQQALNNLGTAMAWWIELKNLLLNNDSVTLESDVILEHYPAFISLEQRQDIANKLKTVEEAKSKLIKKETVNLRSSITQTASEIRLEVSQEVQRLDGEIETAQSSITQNAQEIELKVSKDGVISSINQSAEAIKISANKVNIQGAVTFESFASGLRDSIFVTGKTTINGGNIETGSITAEKLAAKSITISNLDDNFTKDLPINDNTVFSSFAAEQNNKISAIIQDVDGIELTVASHSGTLGTHASQISQNAQSITSKVAQSDYNGNTIASLINQTATTIALSATKIDLNGITSVNKSLRVGGANEIGEVILYGSSVGGTGASWLYGMSNALLIGSQGDISIGSQGSGRKTAFTGTVDFSGATVAGLNVTYKFA